MFINSLIDLVRIRTNKKKTENFYFEYTLKNGPSYAISLSEKIAFLNKLRSRSKEKSNEGLVLIATLYCLHGEACYLAEKSKHLLRSRKPDLDLISWRARCVFELLVWIYHCLSSKTNAIEFYNDRLLEHLEVCKKHEKTLVYRDIGKDDHDSFLKTLSETSKQITQEVGREFSKRFSPAAEKTPFLVAYYTDYKILSQNTHISATRVMSYGMEKVFGEGVRALSFYLKLLGKGIKEDKEYKKLTNDARRRLAIDFSYTFFLLNAFADYIESSNGGKIEEVWENFDALSTMRNVTTPEREEYFRGLLERYNH